MLSSTYFWDNLFDRPINLVIDADSNKVKVSSSYWDDDYGEIDNNFIILNRLGIGKIYENYIKFNENNYWYKKDVRKIKITHNILNAGFFSCCSVKLHHIVDFINSNKIFPDIVDSSQLFRLYEKDKYTDMTFDFFEHYKHVTDVDTIYPIDYRHDYQYINYSRLDYKCITPLIKKYFSPSVEINEIVNSIEKKYNIVHDNTIAVYYRGTDKYTETALASFEDFYKQIIEIVNINTNIKILLQSDSAGFIDYINDKNLKNIVIINENKSSYTNIGIHNEQSSNTNYYDMLNFLSTIIILSKCKYIICSSGNCSIWIMFYRGNNNNVIQYLNGTWYKSAF